MVRSHIATFVSAGFALALAATATRVEGQQVRDARLAVSATVLAAATRIDHAEANAISSKITGPEEREVQELVTASSTGESVLWIVPRVDGVTIEVVGTDGHVMPVGSAGLRVARTTAGREVSAPVLLRIHAANPELLADAARAPVSLLVDSASR